MTLIMNALISRDGTEQEARNTLAKIIDRINKDGIRPVVALAEEKLSFGLLPSLNEEMAAMATKRLNRANVEDVYIMYADSVFEYLPYEFSLLYFNLITSNTSKYQEWIAKCYKKNLPPKRAAVVIYRLHNIYLSKNK